MPELTTSLSAVSRENLLSNGYNLSLKKIETPADGVIELEILEERLYKEADKMETSKLKVCFLLLQISDLDLWQYTIQLGIYTFHDYVERTFEMSRSTLNECLMVARRFGLYTEVFEERWGKPVTLYAPQYKLDPRYKGYGFKQLYLMRSLSDDEIEKTGITPEMSCREIQKAIKEYQTGLPGKETNTEKVPVIPPEQTRWEVTRDYLKDKPLTLPSSKGGYKVYVDGFGCIQIELVKNRKKT